MRRTVGCLLVLGLIVVSSGCCLLGKSSCAARGTGPTACADGQCTAASQCADAGQCADVSSGAEGSLASGPCDCSSCQAGAQARDGRPRCRLCGAIAQHGRERCSCVGGGLPAGPTYGAVTYPYYTVRGPRDFLLDNPPSIGQ